jgi:PadR family transcriptional regulator, regulatory protein PadR
VSHTGTDPSGQMLKGHLDLLLLAILEAEPLHGYAISQRLRLRSAEAFDVAEGTLYPALHRLEQIGLLSSSWSDSGPRKRRLYAVTAKGRANLAAGRKEWRTFAGGMDAVLFGEVAHG